MKQFIYSCAIAMLALFGARGAMAQGVSYNTTGAPAHASAMLDVQSTSKGVLVPRMTAAQMAAIATPATGLMVFQTDGTAGYYYYSGSAWNMVGNMPAGTTTGDMLYWNGSAWAPVTGGTPGQIMAFTGGGVPRWVSVTTEPLFIGQAYQGGVIAPAPNTNVGGFANGGYWSSTEIDNLIAWYRIFTADYQFSVNKGLAVNVRAVRAF